MPVAVRSSVRAQRLAAGPSPKENREVPPLRYDWAYRLEKRPDCRSWSTAASPTAAKATAHLEHVDGAMLRAAPTTRPYLLHELDVAWLAATCNRAVELLRAYRPLRRRRNSGAACKEEASPGTCSACSPGSRADARSGRC